MLIGEGLTTSAAATEALGRSLGEAIDGPSTWLLEGDLGTGKTVLARGLLRGLGVDETVRSPSFTLAIPYGAARHPAVHLDLYRLEDRGAIESLGWEDFLDGSQVLIIEWGERVREIVGEDHIEVVLEHRGGDRRWMRIDAHGSMTEKLGRSLTQAWIGASATAVGPNR